MQHLHDLLESHDVVGERVGVRAGSERDADQRLERAAAGGGVDERDEARDDAGGAQAAHALGCGVRAEADGRAEVAPREPCVLTEQTEDLTVRGVHHSEYRSLCWFHLAFLCRGRQKRRAMDPGAALLAGLVAGIAIAMQVGAVSLLLIEASVVRGPRVGIAAGMGVATADLAYAVIAAVAGGAVGAALSSHESEIKVIAAVVLAA